jgi:solute carrier family 25 folate transporter 32
VRHDGWRSLWRGTGAQLLTGIPNSLQFPIYEASKRNYRRLVVGKDGVAKGDKSAVGFSEVTACTFVTKAVIGVMSHPLQLLKARLMDLRARDGEVTYHGVVQAAAIVTKREGPRGLYRGFFVGLAHTVPRAWLQFQLFEKYLSVA